MKFICLSIICLSGCTKIYDHELDKISKLCGGSENINRIWVDFTTVRAICQNGDPVNAGNYIGDKK